MYSFPRAGRIRFVSVLVFCFGLIFGAAGSAAPASALPAAREAEAAQMASGWQYIDGSWYYGVNGSPATGWLNRGGTWYYLDPQKGGKMAVGLFSVGGRHYAASDSGAMFSSSWVSVGEDWYFAGDSGAFVTGWLNRGGTWFYLDPQKGGKMAAGMQNINGSYYYFAGSGAMLTGWFSSADKYYYALGSGAVVIAEKYTDGVKYFYTPDGKPSSGWVSVEGQWYWTKPDGSLPTQWVRSGDDWYYVESGVPAKNTWKLVGRWWYYLKSDGVMATGWLNRGGTWYYLDPQNGGAMAVGRLTIEGKVNCFNASGAWEGTEDTLSKPVIDISHHQKPADIDYDLLASQISGAIIRVGYTGTGSLEPYMDETFNRHYWELTRRGVHVGAYWYSAAHEGDDGVREARAALKYLNGRHLDLPLYIDVEDPTHQEGLSRKDLTDQAIQFIRTVRGGGYSPGIYSGALWFKNKLDRGRLDGVTPSYWVAHWTGKSRPSFSGKYDLWQYTSKGRLDGYAKNLDLSRRG